MQLRAWSAQVLLRLRPGELVLAGAAWRAGAGSCGLESLEVLAVAASWALKVLLLNGALLYQFLVVPAILPIMLPALLLQQWRQS